MGDAGPHNRPCRTITAWGDLVGSRSLGPNAKRKRALRILVLFTLIVVSVLLGTLIPLLANAGM